LRVITSAQEVVTVGQGAIIAEANMNAVQAIPLSTTSNNNPISINSLNHTNANHINLNHKRNKQIPFDQLLTTNNQQLSQILVNAMILQEQQQLQLQQQKSFLLLVQQQHTLYPINLSTVSSSNRHRRYE